LFEESAPATARDLFRDQHSIEINNEATRRRALLNQDSKYHAGIFQTVLKERWDGLPEDERERWHDIAIKAQEKDSAAGQGQIYE
jgi:hypothetical protein